jgi:hypothetical protein
MSTITDPQVKALNFIKGFLSLNGFPPSRKELAQGMGYKSPNAAQDLLTRMEKNGLVKVAKNMTRSIQIVSEEDVEPGKSTPVRFFAIQNQAPSPVMQQAEIKKAIAQRDAQSAYALLIGNEAQYADALVKELLPTSRSAQFLIRHLGFIERHLTNIFQTIEGRQGAACKVKAAIRLLTRTYMPNEEFSEKSRLDDCELATGKAFPTQSELFRFIDALQDLSAGSGEKYYDFLRNHRPIKKHLKNDLKSQQVFHSRNNLSSASS